MEPVETMKLLAILKSVDAQFSIICRLYHALWSHCIVTQFFHINSQFHELLITKDSELQIEYISFVISEYFQLKSTCEYENVSSVEILNTKIIF